MIVQLPNASLYDLVKLQLSSNFLCTEEDLNVVEKALPEALQRTESNFERVGNKYYWSGGELIFNPFNSNQYTVFLYYLSATVARLGVYPTADKIYFLNKMLSSCDLFYEVELPSVFYVEHPVGSVIGRARIGDFFVFQQNCTVGSNKGSYPEIGEYVWMFPRSSIVGESKIGNNVFISAGCYIKDEVIPDNSLVFGSSPALTVKSRPEAYFKEKSPFVEHRG